MLRADGHPPYAVSKSTISTVRTQDSIFTQSTASGSNYFPHRAHEGVIDEIAAAVEKTIETIAKAEAAAALEAL
jgi:hypothetical protein